jgi:hypothetical protein
MNMTETINKRQSEYQKFPKKTLNVLSRLVLLNLPDGSIIEEGSARIENISLSEVLVSDIKLPSRSLPLETFQVVLFIQDEVLDKIHMLCSVRKINTNGKISMRLRIDRIPEKHQARLWEFIRK